MTPAPRTPLETLVLRTPVDDVRAFFMGSSSIRRSLESQDESRLGLPLRGAMPMFWAANGAAELEDPAVPEDMSVEIPIGTYHYVAADGSPRVRSPSKRVKRDIVGRALAEAGVDEGEKLTLIDEIQGGGTVVQLVRGSLYYARTHNLSLPIHLIAAEDTRAANTKKTGGYRRISTNQREGVTTTIVRLPLIGCDRDNLLDRVDFAGEDHLEKEALNLFSVERNTESEHLFRTMGSMMRSEELRHDDDFIRETFDPMIEGGTEVAEKFEAWIGGLLTPEPAQ